VEFLNEYQWITMTKGDSHSYISMQVSVHSGMVTLHMRYYLGSILEDHNNLQVAVTPGGKNDFMVNGSVDRLEVKKKMLQYYNGQATVFVQEGPPQ
jgi:hypothetical protein